MIVKSLRWTYISASSWKWKDASGIGDDPVFVNNVHISNPSYDATYNYKGFGWESFYKSWQDKLSLVKESVQSRRFSNQISELVDWVANNNTAATQEVFEQHFRPLNYESRETLLAVLEDYNEQYNILAEDCIDYEEFETLIVFLQDLPHQIVETMIELKASEETPDERPTEARIYYKGNTQWQENAYIMSKMLETNPTSSFILEGCEWN